MTLVQHIEYITNMLVNSARLAIPFDVAPFSLSGTVYGTLLNHRSALAALGDSVNALPYKGAPKAPVLYIKPRNTLASTGDIVYIPVDATELEVGACLGVVIGRVACRVSEMQALDYLAGYLIMNDISVPHSSFHRPSVRFKARDGFCPLGPRVTPRTSNTSLYTLDPDKLTIRIHIDGVLMQTSSTADLVRSVGRLLQDVTEFMTLQPGDVLGVGIAGAAPRVRGGQSVDIDIDGLGRLSNQFVSRAL